MFTGSRLAVVVVACRALDLGEVIAIGLKMNTRPPKSKPQENDSGRGNGAGVHDVQKKNRVNLNYMGRKF